MCSSDLDKGTGFMWQPKSGDDIANCLRANAALAPTDNTIDRKSVVQGKSVDLGGRRIIKKKKRKKRKRFYYTKKAIT